eukprot:6212019-Pleurochrysis_carterae.AAC.2
MENFNITSTPTRGIGALAVNGPSGLVLADDPEPNGSSKSLPNQKRDQRGNYVLVGTSERADLRKAFGINNKDDMEMVSAVPKPFGMDVAGTPGVSPSRDARLLEMKDDAYSGLLARVCGSPDPRAMRASRSSPVGGGDKGQPEGVLAVHGSYDLGKASALDESPSRDACLLEVKDDACSGLLARVRGSPDPRAIRASRSSPVGGGDKGHSKRVSTAHGSSDLGMVGALDELPSRDACLLEVKDDAYSGLLARVRGSPDLRAMRASRSSPVGGGYKNHSESAPAVHGPFGLNMADAFDVLFFHDARRSSEEEKMFADSPPPEM